MLKGSQTGEKSFSKPIVGIAVAGIAVGMIVMILSMAIVTGFKTEVRNKVSGFGAHIQVTNIAMNNSYESEAMLRIPELPGQMAAHPEVKSVSAFATKPGIVETSTDIQGVISKGLGSDFDWSFFGDKLTKGTLPVYSDTATSNQVLVSETLANLLLLDTNDRLTIYFSNLSGTLTPRRFEISGLYNTGLEDFDTRFVFMDIGHLQRINRWGLEAQLRVTEDCSDGRIVIEALAFGGDGQYRFRWSDPALQGPGPHGFCFISDSTISVLVSDRSATLPDSAAFSIQYPDTASGCLCPHDGHSKVTTSGGSGKHYIGGYDVVLHDFRALYQTEYDLYADLDYDLKTSNISDRIPEIFNWLEMIDINPKIIIALMIVVAVINMSSALLILILERVNMIGILKALGANNWSIRQIFLRTAAHLIGRGLLIGNALGIGLSLAQHYFKVVKLDPVNYYVSEVPVLIKWEHIVLLNAGTLIICLLVLIIPSMFVSRISPVKAIRFD